MPPTWFRVPEWVWTVNDPASGKKARAWVYLLGSWHAGNDPGIREVMRATGYGGGMTTALVREVARWARDAGARLPEQYIDSAGTVPKSSKPQVTPPINDDESSAGTVDRFYGNDSRARVPYETRRDETRTDHHTDIPPADADDPTPPTTPEADREPEPTHSPPPESRPDAGSQADGVGGHAERGEQAPATGQPPTGDPRAEPHPGRAGPTVAAWEALDAIRRRNVKGAGKLVMTAAMGKWMKERLREHSADDLALMVEWVTGCRCSAKECRACSWLQPKGYTHPKTYLRPDNCSEYLDLAKQAGATSPTPNSEPMDWTEADAARLVVQRVLDSAAELHHRDERILWLAKRTITHIGKRAAWRGKGSTVEWISAWRKEWPASLEAYAVYQQQKRAGVAK